MPITKRKPDSLGDILREEFIDAYCLTQEEVAKAMGVNRTLVSELVNDRRVVTIDIAIMLGKVFNTSPEFWINLYVDNQLWKTLHDPSKKAKFKKITKINRSFHNNRRSASAA